jgi:hypothetical protein
MKLFLLTLKDSIIQYQGHKRLQIENREERNNFNAFRFLSTRMGYKDDSTLYKMINQSSSRVKMGVDDLEFLCVEMMDDSAAEDFVAGIKEKIALKKEKMKEQYQEQLELLEQK